MIKVNDPITINKTVVKNRITMAPTVKFDYAGPDGCVTEKHISHYRKRAEHGCGLICVEATAVTPDGRFTETHLGLWEDARGVVDVVVTKEMDFLLWEVVLDESV